MKQYLKQIYAAMRPGGIFMFSYNDGDTPAGAGMAENFAQTYMPKSMLKPLCESVGFDIDGEFDFETNISWLEVKKPGQLQTVKAHQVLGEINPIVP
jgi:predicted methyltransferase